MDITIHPAKLSGNISTIPSKSQAHRYLICAAFANAQTNIICPDTNQDIEATADCLRALGAQIRRTEDGYCVTPISEIPKTATLPCRESGSTLRFMLPIAGALGVKAVFKTEGRLSQRPLSPLWEEMKRMGCTLQWTDSATLLLDGKLRPGDYHIDGGVSSQFITGLLFAAPLMDGASHIHIHGTLESKPYIAMTQQAMSLFGIHTENFQIRGGQAYSSPLQVTVEGDWSNGAFWLAGQAFGNELKVSNLELNSAQGDRIVADILTKLEENISICAADIPDLVPILSVVAAVNNGAVFTNIGRLRLKESDRVASTIAMINGLGGKAEADENTLTVYGTGLTGGTVDSFNDHRIAMSAAIASTVCKEPVSVLGAECVKKSYPKFWDEFTRLGGKYEQYLR